MKSLKALLLLPIAAMISCGDSAEGDNIPANVKSAFESEYAGATEVVWEQDEEGYEVEFNWNGEKMEVTYGEDGSVIEVEGGNAGAEETMPETEEMPQDEMNMEGMEQQEGDAEAGTEEGTQSN